MENNTKFEEFVNIMDTIGNEIAVFSEKNDVCLLYSGGMDSTAMLLSLVNANAPITIAHLQDVHPKTSYATFRECMAKEVSAKFNVPLWIEECRNEYDFYKIIKKRFPYAIDGDGMDRMYFEYYTKAGKTKHFSYGEPFRAFHPYLDMFFAFAPSRFSSYGVPRSHKIGDSWYNLGLKDAMEANITLIKYSYHPLMLEFFSRYREDVGDIFFRKDFTYRYTKNKLGKSYHKLVRDVCRKNKLESNIERFFNLIEKRKIKKRIDSVKKRHEQLSLTQDGTWTEEK